MERGRVALLLSSSEMALTNIHQIILTGNKKPLRAQSYQGLV